MSGRRLNKELSELHNDPLEGITVEADEMNMNIWEVTMNGPPRPSPYYGGKFKLSVEFGLDYPFKPPHVKFKTKMYHPNIDSDGSICIGMLKPDQWKPSSKMAMVFMALFELLAFPNPDDPLVSSIADQYRQDRKAFDRKAAEFTTKYAT